MADNFINNSATASLATVVLLFKRPLLGQGKQRLAASLGLEQTLALAERFLDCALEDLAGWPGPVVLAPAHPEDRTWAEHLLPRAVVAPQNEGDLGQRIVELDQRLRSQGHQQLIYIGSDAPALTPAHYRAAGQQLGAVDVVLSAATDGGVTLMACARPWPVALIELPWSSDQLGKTLAACCHNEGLSVDYIAPSYDIDIEQDLARLTQDLADDARPARQALQQLLRTLSRSGACVSV